MIVAGIDIGSRAVKLVVLENGSVVIRRVVDTSHDPVGVCRSLLEDVETDYIVGTGYGRRLFSEYWPGVRTITEIKAVARGTIALKPDCRLILDIGGQDSKAIALDEVGRVLKFQMNDRCAAGTGRFLEVMATALGLSQADFIEAATHAGESVALSSMCAVFAETEVISLVGRGVARDKIALGIHQSVVKKMQTLIRSLPVVSPVVFTGGAALNGLLAKLLQNSLGVAFHTLDSPQTVAAYGCALEAAQLVQNGWEVADAS